MIKKNKKWNRKGDTIAAITTSLLRKHLHFQAPHHPNTRCPSSCAATPSRQSSDMVRKGYTATPSRVVKAPSFRTDFMLQMLLAWPVTSDSAAGPAWTTTKASWRRGWGHGQQQQQQQQEQQCCENGVFGGYTSHACRKERMCIGHDPKPAAEGLSFCCEVYSGSWLGVTAYGGLARSN